MESKSLWVLGSFAHDDNNDLDEKGEKKRIIVYMTKESYNHDQPSLLEAGIRQLQITDIANNDRYYKATGYTSHNELNMVHMLFTYPAKEADVIKIRRMNSKSYLVKETPEIYTNIVKPIITKPSPSRNLQWLDNILQKKEEADKIIYDDPDPRTGFVLLPNHNWENKENIDNLYCLGICYQRVLSLREIRGEHISLLENMLEAGCKAIEHKYGLKANQIRVFLHYQPSFYHLHVHYTNLACNVPQAIVERAHLLQDVIDNLKTDPDYYQHKTLYYRVLNTDEIALALNL